MNSRIALKKARRFIEISFISAMMSAFSLGLIPIISVVGNSIAAISYFIAAVFWFGWLTFFISVYLTRQTLVRYREKMIIKGLIKKHQPIGLVSFSKDLRMLILYGITILGLILIVSDIILGYAPEAVMFPIISVTVLSFTLHCIIDGKYYKVYKLIKESVNNGANS